MAYHGNKIFEDLLKPVVRIQNNLVEIVTGRPSTKKAKTNLIHQKTWSPGGVASFHYVPLGKL